MGKEISGNGALARSAAACDAQGKTQERGQRSDGFVNSLRVRAELAGDFRVGGRAVRLTVKLNEPREVDGILQDTRAPRPLAVGPFTA